MMVNKMIKPVLFAGMVLSVIQPAIILAADNNLASISAAGNNTAAAIRPFDGEIINNSLAVSPDEQTAVVSDSRQPWIRVYDLAQGTLRKEIRGFVTPRNIMFINGGLQFVVSDSTLGTLRFYNTEDLALKDEVAVGQGAFGTDVTADGNTMYVNNEAKSTVTVVDLGQHKTTAVIPGFSQPRQGIKVSPDGRYVFVTNFKGDKVSVVDVKTNSIIHEISGFSKIRAISISADGSTMYAANSGRNSIAIVDISQGKIIGEVKVGRDPYGASLSPDGKILFASNKLDNSINIISTSDNSIIGSIKGFLEPRQAISFSKDGNFAYVLNRDLSISRVDVKAGMILDTVSDKDDIYYDVKVNVKGNPIQSEEYPYYKFKADIIYVPVRFVSEALGATVEWNNDFQTIQINYNGKINSVNVGGKTALAGDQQIQLDGPVEKNGERTFVPLSFISKVMGASVKWDNPSRTVNITPVK